MEQKYIVQSGDTLGGIANHFYGDSSKYTLIAEANHIKNPNSIQVGRELIIPETDARLPADANSVKNENLITVEQLREILPYAKEENIIRFAPSLNRELPKFQINTPLRVAQFIAQIAVESASLNATSENLNYSASALRRVFGRYFPSDELAEQYDRQPQKIANRVYANRMGNGNEASGEGWKYRGRGLIQLTGKANYVACGTGIGKSLETNPDSVSSDADIAVQTCCWYWNSRKLNQYADQDDIKKITKLINGGYHGSDQRQAFLDKAKQVLMPNPVSNLS
ncbi:MAG: LysM peptidoglycan-binding domain-containing protein [Marinilabiliaceae bacterium]|nr:LysM peptidoglycan-binding domain-containing protein [Marinilabiliaceae bacterium]